MLLLQTSAASSSHALTVHHAYARLGDLKAQLRHLQAAAAAELAQQQVEKRQAEQLEAEQQQAQRAEAAKQEAEASKAENLHIQQGQHRKKQVDSAAQHVSSRLPAVEAPTSALKQTSAPSHAQHGAMSSGSSIVHVAREPVPLESIPLSKPRQAVQSAPKSLLEIQAEQEAESAQAAAAKAAVSSPAKRRNKPGHLPSASSPAQQSSSDSKSQARVLQVKRQKPGQNPAANIPAANVAAAIPVKVLPLPRNAAGKAAAAEAVAAPAKIKLMARPQVGIRPCCTHSPCCLPFPGLQAESTRARTIRLCSGDLQQQRVRLPLSTCYSSSLV